MARRKAPDTSGGSGDWLNTYADMVTLLLTFFILMFAMSNVNEQKFNQLAEAFRAHGSNWMDRIAIDTGTSGGTTTPNSASEGRGVEQAQAEPEVDVTTLPEVYEHLKEYLDEHPMGDQVQISQGDGYVFIRFMDGLLFQPNSDTLKASDLEMLNFIGYGIKAVQDKAAVIRIDGFTAAILDNPNYPVSDRRLSSNRANAVLIYFEDVIGIDGEKLIAVSHGKYRPIADNDTEENMARNRRVEILISDENSLSKEADLIYEKLLND
ncbi:flagellar motor protein MotB [Oscillospiraceae bacterium MB08-C2-2]|nr:flagellar motor protein MotB [Oscillospiraceae bacterium MB08-C2-2]